MISFWPYFYERSFFGFGVNLLLSDFEDDVFGRIVGDEMLVAESVDEEFWAEVVRIKEAASIARNLNAKSRANWASFFALILDLSGLPNNLFRDGIL